MCEASLIVKSSQTLFVVLVVVESLTVAVDPGAMRESMVVVVSRNSGVDDKWSTLVSGGRDVTVAWALLLCVAKLRLALAHSGRQADRRYERERATDKSGAMGWALDRLTNHRRALLLCDFGCKLRRPHKQHQFTFKTNIWITNMEYKWGT